MVKLRYFAGLSVPETAQRSGPIAAQRESRTGPRPAPGCTRRSKAPNSPKTRHPRTDATHAGHRGAPPAVFFALGSWRGDELPPMRRKSMNDERWQRQWDLFRRGARGSGGRPRRVPAPGLRGRRRRCTGEVRRAPGRPRAQRGDPRSDGTAVRRFGGRPTPERPSSARANRKLPRSRGCWASAGWAWSTPRSRSGRSVVAWR